MITGVGSSYFREDIYHPPTVKVDEFEAVGRGGSIFGPSGGGGRQHGHRHGPGAPRGGQTTHLGADRHGGGTLLGLSLMLKVRDFKNIVELAKGGDLSRIDLTIGDISKEKVSVFTDDITASNFGNVMTWLRATTSRLA